MAGDRYETFVLMVISVRNSIETIEELLESLIKLDYNWERLEILVVDGRSTDETREIIEKYPVRVLDEEGRGLNAARNTG